MIKVGSNLRALWVQFLPLDQQKQKGKRFWMDPPERAGDPPPPQDSLQALSGCRSVMTLGTRAALWDRQKPKATCHDSDEIGSSCSYPVPDNIKRP